MRRKTDVDAIREQPRRDLVVREAPITPRTIDEETRSIEAVFATEARVSNLDLTTWEVVDEILLMRGYQAEPKTLLFDSHPETYGNPRTDDIRGSAREMRVEGDKLLGRIYFAADQASEDLWGKYRDGHADSVSPGFERLKTYRIEPGKTKKIGGKEYTAGERPLHVTTKWRMAELSTVPWGADVKAKVRQEPSTLEKPMNSRLRKYLESLGLRSEATDLQAQQFTALLSGQRAEIANLLETETASETAKRASRARLKELGVDPDDPSKPLATRQAQDDPPADPPAGDGSPPASPPADAPDADALRAEGQRLERERVAAIRRLAGDAGDVPQELVTRAIDANWDEQRTTSEFLAAIRQNRGPGVGAGPAIHSRNHDVDCNVRSLAAGQLIANGFDPTKQVFGRNFGAGEPRPMMLGEQDAELGHRFHDLSAVDLCREACRIDGGQIPTSRHEAIRTAVSGGTLSYVMGTNVYAKLNEGWEKVGDTTLGWCDEEDVPNFLQQEDISITASSRLEKLPRGDTAKHASISDTHETYKLARYAKQFVADDQDFLDDRLGAILRMPAEMGEAARRLRPDLVYAIILENPSLIADSIAVFHASHNNLAANALSSINLKTGISAMGKQRENNKVLNITARYLIVPAALEWTADELCTTNSIAKLFADSDEPIYATENLIARRRLMPVMDDRIGATGVVDPRTGTVTTGSDTTWYLAAGGSKSIRVAYLRGTGRRPQLRSFQLTQGQWGLGWDINHDVAAAFMCYRPWYKSVG